MDDYNDKIKSQMEEVVDDIQVFNSFRVTSSVTGESITNIKKAVGILGSVVSLLTPFVIANIWNPAAWIVGGISVVVVGVVSGLTSLFRSKAEKITKAIKHMRDQLVTDIDRSMKGNQKDFFDKVEKSIEDTSSSFLHLLSTYIEGTKKIICEIDNLCQQIVQEESAINSLVSFRLLEYVDKTITEDIDALDSQALALKYPVERDWIKQSLFYKYKVHLTRKKITRITQATQMTIITN